MVEFNGVLRCDGFVCSIALQLSCFSLLLSPSAVLAAKGLKLTNGDLKPGNDKCSAPNLPAPAENAHSKNRVHY